MDGESREVQVEDVIKTRVEEGAFLVTGKVMYGRSELGSALNYLFFGNMCLALLPVSDL